MLDSKTNFCSYTGLKWLIFLKTGCKTNNFKMITSTGGVFLLCYSGSKNSAHEC